MINRILSVAAFSLAAALSFGQPHLRPDNIDDIVKVSAGGFTASVTVTNTGSVAGKEVVEVYVSAPS